MFQRVSHYFRAHATRTYNSFPVGMGKTIMLSSLIQTSRGPDPSEAHDNETTTSTKRRQLRLNDSFRPSKGQRTRVSNKTFATLVIAPTSLLSQWSEELVRSSKPDTMKVVVWHGTNRRDLDAAVQMSENQQAPITVVITSYGVLASEHAKIEKSGSLVFESKSSHPKSDLFRSITNTATPCSLLQLSG